MLHISHETPEQTRTRLLEVLAAATLEVYERPYVFEELPVDGPPPELRPGTLALVRDDDVWSRLVPAPDGTRGERFGLIRIHFPEGLDNSGFVGWLATHLKQRLGTGVFVICGQNSDRGGIFDYTGFPAELRDLVLAEIRRLRAAGAALPSADD